MYDFILSEVPMEDTRLWPLELSRMVGPFLPYCFSSPTLLLPFLLLLPVASCTRKLAVLGSSLLCQGLRTVAWACRAT